MSKPHILRDWNGAAIDPDQMHSVSGCSIWSAEGLLIGDFDVKLVNDAEPIRAAHVRLMLQAPMLLDRLELCERHMSDYVQALQELFHAGSRSEKLLTTIRATLSEATGKSTIPSTGTPT